MPWSSRNGGGGNKGAQLQPSAKKWPIAGDGPTKHPGRREGKGSPQTGQGPKWGERKEFLHETGQKGVAKPVEYTGAFPRDTSEGPLSVWLPPRPIEKRRHLSLDGPRASRLKVQAGREAPEQDVGGRLRKVNTPKLRRGHHPGRGVHLQMKKGGGGGRGGVSMPHYPPRPANAAYTRDAPLERGAMHEGSKRETALGITRVATRSVRAGARQKKSWMNARAWPHRVPENSVARQEAPDDAANHGAAVQADAQVEPATLERDRDFRRGLSRAEMGGGGEGGVGRGRSSDAT